MAQVILDVKQPTLSLLNIGEEIKGLDEIKSSHEMLKSTEYFFRYKGFIEGIDWQRFSDVVVTDGFTGNIALKTAEGTMIKFHNISRTQ